MLSFNRPVSLNSAPIGLITVSSQYYKYVKKVVIKTFRALVVFFIAGWSIWVGVLCLFVCFFCLLLCRTVQHVPIMFLPEDKLLTDTVIV